MWSKSRIQAHFSLLPVWYWCIKLISRDINFPVPVQWDKGIIYFNIYPNHSDVWASQCDPKFSRVSSFHNSSAGVCLSVFSSPQKLYFLLTSSNYHVFASTPEVRQLTKQEMWRSIPTPIWPFLWLLDHQLLDVQLVVPVEHLNKHLSGPDTGDNAAWILFLFSRLHHSFLGIHQDFHLRGGPLACFQDKLKYSSTFISHFFHQKFRVNQCSHYWGRLQTFFAIMILNKPGQLIKPFWSFWETFNLIIDIGNKTLDDLPSWWTTSFEQNQFPRISVSPSMLYSLSKLILRQIKKVEWVYLSLKQFKNLSNTM